jgi:hypothetical protein
VLDLNTGDNITLNCIGEEPLSWTYPVVPVSLAIKKLSSRFIHAQLYVQFDRLDTIHTVIKMY